MCCKTFVIQVVFLLEFFTRLLSDETSHCHLNFLRRAQFQVFGEYRYNTLVVFFVPFGNLFRKFKSLLTSPLVLQPETKRDLSELVIMMYFGVQIVTPPGQTKNKHFESSFEKKCVAATRHKHFTTQSTLSETVLERKKRFSMHSRENFDQY